MKRDYSQSANLTLKSDVDKNFCKSRPVPYALWPKLLGKMAKESNVEIKFQYGPVMKMDVDRSETVCRDYKVTLNAC